MINFYKNINADLYKMTFTLDMPKVLKKLDQATHFDNTSRVQLVNRNNLQFFKLLTEVEKKLYWSGN